MSHRHRVAFTLTELLVTMLISLTIMAIALPMVKFNLDESRVREASRQLNAMFAKAKAEAALSGRPVGLMFLRDPNDTNRCRQFLLAEVPAPFGGIITNSTCGVKFDSTSKFELSFSGAEEALVIDLVKNQDPTKAMNPSQFGIQFDFKGPVHIAIYNPTGMPKFSISSTNPQLIPSSNPTFVNQHTFQIHRLPTAVNTQPIELARGTYIALDQSGTGGVGKEFAGGNQPVIVMMSPNGHVGSYYPNGTPTSPTATLHFLCVRERNEANAVNPMLDPTNLWVSVGHLSGTITTSDNYPVANQERSYAQRHDVRGGR